MATYGEKVVGADFNPSGDPKVAQLKKLFAEAIDICAEELEGLDPDEMPGPIYREAILRSLDAQMWCVKGVTWRK